MILQIITLALLGYELYQNYNFREDNKKYMASQEERLQAVVTGVQNLKTKLDEVSAELANVKANNPDIEDELETLEGLLGEAQSAVANVPSATDEASASESTTEQLPTNDEAA